MGQGQGRTDVPYDREEEIGPAVLLWVVIELSVPHDLELKEREEDSHHPGKPPQAGLDLLSDLVLEEAGMVLHVVVEDEEVGEAGEEEVHDVDAEHGEEDEGEELAGDVVAGPGGDGGEGGGGEGEVCGGEFWVGDVGDGEEVVP